MPLPLINPLHPSSFHIFISPLPTDNLYSSRPALWTWKRILSLSSGETTVLETAPATPPAQNAATTGCAISSRSCKTFGPSFGLNASPPDYVENPISHFSPVRLESMNLQQTFRVDLQPIHPQGRKLDAYPDPSAYEAEQLPLRQ